MQNGHSIVASAADEALWATFFTEFHMTEGRHAQIATAENSKANALAVDYKNSTLDMLSSLIVDASTRIISTMMPVASSDHVSDVDRVAHVARLNRDCDAHLRRLNALTACVTQLVALEHAYVERFTVMNEDVYRHESTADSVCVGCEMTEHAQAQNRALHDQLVEGTSTGDAAATMGPSSDTNPRFSA